MNIPQLKKSGIIEEFEVIIESKPAIIKNSINGIIVLTDSRFLFISRSSLLSKSYIVKVESGLLNIRNVNTAGILKRDMIVQFKNLDMLTFRLHGAEYLSKKIQAMIKLCKRKCIEFKAEQLKFQHEQHEILKKMKTFLENREKEIKQYENLKNESIKS